MTSAPIPLTPEHYTTLWFDALREEIGITVPVSDPTKTPSIMYRLYEARKDLGDPRLDCLSIKVPEDASCLYIFKREVDLDD